MTYRPSVPVTADLVSSVATFRALIVTPGRTAPLASCTVPPMLPVVWAAVAGTNEAATKRTITKACARGKTIRQL
jgi:hypothetical protein